MHLALPADGEVCVLTLTGKDWRISARSVCMCCVPGRQIRSGPVSRSAEEIHAQREQIAWLHPFQQADASGGGMYLRGSENKRGSTLTNQGHACKPVGRVQNATALRIGASVYRHFPEQESVFFAVSARRRAQKSL